LRSVTDVSARRVTVTGAYRNGVAVVSGRNVLLEELEIDSVNGTAPRSVVDLEPNQGLGEARSAAPRTSRSCRASRCAG